MEEKLNEKLTPIAKNIFGEDVKVQSFFDNKYNKYDSLDMNVVEFMNKNQDCSYVLYVFIDGGENIDKVEESKKINVFGENLVDNNLLNRNFVAIWYLRGDEFSKVEEKYYDLVFYGEEFEYYCQEDKIYNIAWFEIVDEKLAHTIEDIIKSFGY